MEKAPEERTRPLEAPQKGMVMGGVFKCRCDMKPERKKDFPKSSMCGIAEKLLPLCHIQGIGKESEAFSSMSGNCFCQLEGEQ